MQSAGAPRLCVRFAMLLIVLVAILFLSGCGHPKPAHGNVPPPPPPASTTESTASQPRAKAPASKENTAPKPREDAEAETGADLAEPTLLADAKPLASETGLASWHGPPYHRHRTRQLAPPPPPHARRIERRSLQLARHVVRAPHLSARLHRARHQR